MKDRYNNDSNKFLQKDYPDKIEKIEEALLHHIGGNDLKSLKTEIPGKWNFLTKQLAHPYECFNSFDDYQRPVDNFKKEDFFIKLKIDYLSDEEIERTNEIIKLFNVKNGEKLTRLFLKSDVLLLTCVFEKTIKVSIRELDINPLYCVSLPGYTLQCGFKYTGMILNNSR